MDDLKLSKRLHLSRIWNY